MCKSNFVRAHGGYDLSAGRTLHVLLVDGDLRTARAIQRDFSRNGITVTATGTLGHARSILRQWAPAVDVVILEIRLADGRGESLLSDIEACPRQPAVIITSQFLSELQADALEYRPVVLAKPIGTAALLRAVRVVAAGYARPTIKRFARRFDLSRRETQTLGFLSQGMTAKEISSRLFCAEKTIYFHLANICRKMDCSDYHEIVGRLVSFACQTLGHTPPEYAAFVENAPLHGS